MSESGPRQTGHILIFEPRVEGHHLGYLKTIADRLLADGYRLTLAVDTSPDAYASVRRELGAALERVAVVAATEETKRSGATVGRVATLLAQTGADLAFLPNLDEIASAMLRDAALGRMPPALLRGRLGGIYLRPRFLQSLGLSPNLWLKSVGFRRLIRGGWFSHLLLLDPYLCARLKSREPDAPAFFLPDYFPADFVADRAEARRRLDLPEDKRVFLFYGAGYRRKGLGLAVAAMLAMPASSHVLLLCAGRQASDAGIAAGLERLAGEGRARVIDRYVSNDEEKQLFAASDAVLLPYIRHFGSSGVLMRAIGAGLPVIASDEELVGRLVRDHGLGVLFRSGDTRALRGAIESVARASSAQMAQWQAAARAVAPTRTQRAFGEALSEAFQHALSRGLGRSPSIPGAEDRRH